LRYDISIKLLILLVGAAGFEHVSISYDIAASYSTSLIICRSLLWVLRESARRMNQPLTQHGCSDGQRVAADGLWAEAVAATTTPWIYDDYYCYHIPYTGASYYPDTLAATAPLSATSPDCTDGRRYFRAITARAGRDDPAAMAESRVGVITSSGQWRDANRCQLPDVGAALAADRAHEVRLDVR
jgi:hypothetical protein